MTIERVGIGADHALGQVAGLGKEKLVEREQPCDDGQRSPVVDRREDVEDAKVGVMQSG